MDAVISTCECSFAFRTLWRTLIRLAVQSSQGAPYPTVINGNLFWTNRTQFVPASWANPIPRNLNNSHIQVASRALNLDYTKTRLTTTEAARSSQLLLKSTFSMGSAGHSVKLRNPWIETPLIESRALSKAAGWYAGDLHSSLASLTLLASQQHIPQTREPAAVWLL